MYQIRTYNKISDKGLSRFPDDKYAVGEDIAQPDAIVLRSYKLHDEPLPDSVLAVARAGAGVNNVPVDEYTKKGIVVFNTPGANANAVKELVLTGMLLSSRGILQGRDFVSGLGDMTDSGDMSKLVEGEKKRFAGSELAGKTLGVVGLGAIGSMVANAALALGMKVVGFDPALSVEAAWRLSSDVERKENLQALLADVDYVSLHVPAIDATKGMINAEMLSVMKPEAVILNFARGGIVVSQDMLAALDAGKLRMYVCDFPEPGMIGHDRIIALPHIGASTKEAEENCAMMAVDQLRDYIEHGNIKNSVNFPAASMGPLTGGCRLTFTNENVSGVLGDVLSVFAENKVNVIDMINKSRNDVAYSILDFDSVPGDSVIEAVKKVKHVISLRVITC